MRVLLIFTLAGLLLLSGCGNGNKQAIVSKLEQAKTGDEIRKLLGNPSKYDAKDMPLIGKVETLTYTASDGEVTVVLHNNKKVLVDTEKKN